MRPGGVETALAAMNQNQQTAQTALRDAVHDLFEQLPNFEPEVPTDLQLRIAASAELTAQARAHVERDRFKKKEIVYVSEPEAPTRLAQQLSQLAKGSALLEGRKAVAREDCQLAVRVALDCIPVNRRKVLDDLIIRRRTKKARLLPLEMPGSTQLYTEGDLKALGVLLDGGGLAPLIVDLLQKACLLERDD